MLKDKQKKVSGMKSRSKRSGKYNKRKGFDDSCDHVLVALLRTCQYLPIIIFLGAIVAGVVALVISTNMSKKPFLSEEAPQIVGKDKWVVLSTFADEDCTQAVKLPYTKAVRLNYCARMYTRSTKYVLDPQTNSLVLEEYEGEDCIANQEPSRTTSNFTRCQRDGNSSYFVKSFQTLDSVNLDPKNPTSKEFPKLLLYPEIQFLEPEVEEKADLQGKRRTKDQSMTAGKCFVQVMDEVNTGYMLTDNSIIRESKYQQHANNNCFKFEGKWAWIWVYDSTAPSYENGFYSTWAEEYFWGAAILVFVLIALNVLQEIYLMVTDEEYEWGWASAPSSTKDGATASQKALAKSVITPQKRKNGCMGSGASSVGTIKKKYKRLPPFTPGEIAKHGPNLIGTEVHLIGYIGLREEKSKKYVVYSPFNRDEYGVYIKINVRKPLQGKTVKKTFTAKAGSCFTLCDGKGRDNVVISMENADDWQANLSVSNRHYNIECADHSRALLRAGGQFDGNRNGMIDRPDLKPFWVTFQNGNDPLYRLQTGADKMFGGRPRNALEYILHLNEKVSIVGVLEMDANTNQYILLPTKNTVKKGKTKIEKIGGITNLSSLSSALKEKSGDASQVTSIDIDKDLIMVSMSEISEVKV